MRRCSLRYLLTATRLLRGLLACASDRTIALRWYSRKLALGVPPNYSEANASLFRSLRAQTAAGVPRFICPSLLAMLSLMLAATGCIEKWADFEVRSISEMRVIAVDNLGVDAVVLCELLNPNAVDARVSDIRFTAKSGIQQFA